MNKREEELAELASELALENERLKQELSETLDLLEETKSTLAKYKMRLDDIWSISHTTNKYLEELKDKGEYINSLANV